MKTKKPTTAPVHEAPRPYKRLQAELAAMIAATAPGERLTAEPQLAQQLGVSRATLREAMRTFEGQGLIRRRQGVGTFVVGNTRVLETGLEVLESIETVARKSGLAVSMASLKITVVDADESLAASLEIAVGAPVTRVTRVIQAEANGLSTGADKTRPVAFLIDNLSTALLSPEDLQVGFTGSVLDFLLQRSSLNLVKAVTEIRSTAASPDLARALQVQRGDPLLMLIAQLYDVNDQVVAYSTSYFLPGTIRFRVVRKVGRPYA